MYKGLKCLTYFFGINQIFHRDGNDPFLFSNTLFRDLYRKAQVYFPK